MPSQRRYRFSNAGEGLFAQDRAETDASQFDHLTSLMGFELKPNDFIAKLKQLNDDAGSDTRYILLYLARHGQGYHNLCMETHGQEAWDNHWGVLNGDGVNTWGPDAELTELGIEQARANGKAMREWTTMTMTSLGIPKPFYWYVSPFTRAIDTMQLTWHGIFELNGFHKAKVVEDLREDLGIDTCNKRRTYTYLEQTFPWLIFPDGFAEEDELWQPDYKETEAEHDVRTQRFLEYLVEDIANNQMIYDTVPCVSVTSHTGTIDSFLRVIGHRPFPVGTGGMIPVLVKVSRG